MLTRHEELSSLVVGDRRFNYPIHDEVEETTPYHFPSRIGRTVESHLVEPRLIPLILGTSHPSACAHLEVVLILVHAQ